MKNAAIIICFILANFMHAQVSCNYSQISPSNIFFKGTNTNYLPGGNVLYVCGPNVSVYDTSDAEPNCHIAFVEGGSVFVFKHKECRGLNTLYLRNNSTLVIRAGSSAPVIYSEPTAKIINETGVSITKYNCVSLEFPNINCLAGNRIHDPVSRVSVFHDRSNGTLEIVAINFGSDPERICFLNTIGEKVMDVNFSNHIGISSLPNGYYTVKVYSMDNPAGVSAKFLK